MVSDVPLMYGIVVALCDVGLYDDSSSNLSICVGFL